VGREDPYGGVFPDIDLTPYGAEEAGVSRRHFKVTVSGANYLIEDLNSTNFTLLNRQRLQPGTPTALADGDEIRRGRIRLLFKVNS
jgi:pSer/pThr/pTyr-binding forkhead associated (FHA) protein